jgi:hypothetical protein
MYDAFELLAVFFKEASLLLMILSTARTPERDRAMMGRWSFMLDLYVMWGVSWVLRYQLVEV